MIARFAGAALAAAPLLTLAAGAFAHATLERTEAAADSYHKVVVRIGHGCEGSPTLKVRVRIPEGVTGAKPQPKPGWEVTIVKEKLKEPIVDRAHNRTITETVAEIAWTGTLLDAHYEEFAMQVKLPDKPGAVLYWLTVQECEKGVHRWIEIPAPGKTARDYKEPAPALKLLPKGQGH